MSHVAYFCHLLEWGVRSQILKVPLNHCTDLNLVFSYWLKKSVHKSLNAMCRVLCATPRQLERMFE